jgi:hypothetical protein
MGTPRMSAPPASLLVIAVAVLGCGSKEPPTMQAATPASTEAVASHPLKETDTTWTPEEMEQLLAPVALYPDVVLGQVLVASTNPTEVLDAGNWLLQNQTREGNALDKAAKQVGFTPTVRALLQSPEVIDMLCQQLSWTTELGQAFINDQSGVLGAVQRLRAQAQDVGNLKSSDQMKVETKVEGNHEVIVITPPSPQVVYVPQYDPVAAYAPPAQPPANNGYSSSDMAMTGLLAFGAGILVANAFDDDYDDYHGGYYPHYHGHPVPYHPPYPYRPTYGNGFYPGHHYAPPPGYQNRSNNNTVVINHNTNYWNSYNNAATTRAARPINSPITAARPNRSELTALNAAPATRATAVQSPSWKGQSSYAGATRSTTKQVAGVKDGGYTSTARAQPKIQGSYAGTGVKTAELRTSMAPSAKYTRTVPPAVNAQSAVATDRGRAAPADVANRTGATALSAETQGAVDRAASQRGRQSMPNGAPASTQSAGRPARR